MIVLPVIGKHERIDLYKEGIFGVPSKIDTGADKCSIWASSVSEKDGVLSYAFFGPGSALYTGEILTTKEYSTTHVKNSFGVTEIRYMIKLSIKLGDKQYKVRFTLADRSRNKFPVLLGMNFLKNHFWVNVAENYLVSKSIKEDNRRVLVVYGTKSKDWKLYFDKVSTFHDKSVSYNAVHVDELVFTFGDKPIVTIGVEGENISDYPLTYLKLNQKGYEQRIAAADYLHYENCRVIDNESVGGISMSKLSEMMRLNCNMMPLPKGIAMATHLMKDNFSLLKKTLGVPFVLKDVYGERGQNNFLIDNETTFIDVLKTAPTSCFFVAQEYIENDGFVRVMVMNKEVPIIIKRTPMLHEDSRKNHLNKPRGGANAEIAKLFDMNEVASISMRAALIMDRQIAGVDALQDKSTKKWYILEVNASPQLIGDKYENEKARELAKFIDYELERS